MDKVFLEFVNDLDLWLKFLILLPLMTVERYIHMECAYRRKKRLFKK